MRIVRLHIQSIENNSISLRKDFSFLLKKVSNICFNVALYNSRIETLISIPEVLYVFWKSRTAEDLHLNINDPLRLKSL